MPAAREHLNWVDPDIVAAIGETAAFDEDREREFKEFFETDWLDPKFDDLRARWDPLLYDQDPHGRVLAKTALWAVVQLRAFRER